MNLKVFDEKSDRNIQIRINPEFERLVPQLTSKDTIPIKDIIIKERYRKEFGDIDTLADNISSVGLLQPVVINENNELIDGQRRILAYQKLGRNEIPCFKIDLEEIVLGEFSANTHRKDFVPSEAVRIKKAIEPYQKQEAKERQLAGKKQPSGKLPEGETRDIVANFVGVGERTLQKAEKIVDAADKNQKYQKYVDEMDAGKKVGRIYRKYIHDVKTEEQLNTTPSIPLPKDYDLRLGNFIEILKNIPDNSIDFIITRSTLCRYSRKFITLQRIGKRCLSGYLNQKGLLFSLQVI